MTKHLATVLSLAIGIAAVGGAPARADISSWFWSDGKQDGKAPTKSITQSPSAQPAPGQSGGAEDPKTAADPEAAYRAFDQGKYLTALRLAERHSKTNHPASHTLIGRIYAEGLGVSQDLSVAAQWYKRGAELGDVNAMFAMGLMFARGQGVAKDVNTAASLFESAARTGHAEANYNLGLLFLNGSGKPKNVHRAALHIGYAAEQGIAAAQYDYAGLVEQGVGVEQNAYEQARWLSKAAEQGLAAAQYEYAVMLLRGRGLKVDVPKAIVLLKDAARKGVAGAQNRLAHVYDEGVRVSPDPLQMAKWRFLAAEAGFDDAALDSKVAALPAETRLKAQQLAARFRDTALVAPLSLQ